MTSPDSYAWLATGFREVAGCVTVVGGVGRSELMHLLGADGGEVIDEDDLDGDAAAFHPVAGGTVAAEGNGFQGTRADVLVPASLASPSGRAASIYWNENVGVRFTCAEAGRMVASVELPPYDEDELDPLPADLRALVLPHVDSEDVDPVALGAAMVELYTGIGFSEPDVDLVGMVRINPRPAHVEDDRRDTTALAREFPGLVAEIGGWTPVQQRALVLWILRRVLDTAGVADDPDFSSVLDNVGVLAPGPLPDAARARFAAISREADEESMKEREEDARTWPPEGEHEDEELAVLTFVVTDDRDGTAHPSTPSEAEWAEIVARLRSSDDPLLTPDDEPGWDDDDPEGLFGEDMYSESRYRALNLLQWAAGVAQAALHPDATTAAWRSLHGAIYVMDAAERVHDRPYRDAFLADLAAQFLPGRPGSLLVPKPDPVDAARDLSAPTQRELVEWAASFFARAAGVADDPDFAAVLRQFGRGQQAVIPPPTAARFERIEADLAAEHDRRAAGHRGSDQVRDPLMMLSDVADAVRRACHDDLRRAAANVVGSAEMTLVHIALATDEQHEDAFWAELETRFGIAR